MVALDHCFDVISNCNSVLKLIKHVYETQARVHNSRLCFMSVISSINSVNSGYEREHESFVSRRGNM